jgi:O-antigen ligase
MEMASWSLVACEIYLKWRNRTPQLRSLWFPYWKPMVALTVVVLIGLTINPLGRPFMFQFGWIRWILLMYFFAWFFHENWSEQFDNRLRKVWVVCLCISCAYSILECLTGIDLIRPGSGALEHTGVVWRATGFFSAALTFAYCTGYSFFAVSIPAQKLKPKLWGIATIIFGVGAIIASLGRGAWIALIVAGFVYFAFDQRKKLPYFIGGVVLVGAALCIYPSAIQTKILNLLELHVDHSSMMRWHLWQAYWEIFKDHPLFGAGIFQGDFLVPAAYEKLGIVEPFVSHSHNVYLGWLANTGIFGLGIYLYICFIFLRMAWRLRAKTDWGWSLFLAQIYLHVGAITENNFFDGEVNHWAMFGWAMCLGLTRYYETKPGLPPTA